MSGISTWIFVTFLGTAFAGNLFGEHGSAEPAISIYRIRNEAHHGYAHAFPEAAFREVHNVGITKTITPVVTNVATHHVHSEPAVSVGHVQGYTTAAYGVPRVAPVTFNTQYTTYAHPTVGVNGPVTFAGPAVAVTQYEDPKPAYGPPGVVPGAPIVTEEVAAPIPVAKYGAPAVARVPVKNVAAFAVAAVPGPSFVRHSAPFAYAHAAPVAPIRFAAHAVPPYASPVVAPAIRYAEVEYAEPAVVAPAPVAQYGAPAPVAQYGVPAPVAQYGAPAPVPVAQYGAPAFAAAPVVRYGVPAVAAPLAVPVPVPVAAPIRYAAGPVVKHGHRHGHGHGHSAPAFGVAFAAPVHPVRFAHAPLRVKVTGPSVAYAHIPASAAAFSPVALPFAAAPAYGHAAPVIGAPLSVDAYGHEALAVPVPAFTQLRAGPALLSRPRHTKLSPSRLRAAGGYA